MDTYISGARNTRPESQSLANKIYELNRLDYRPVFNQGYQKLDQPFDDGSNRDAVINEGTQTLATAYIDQFFKKSGKLPSEDQVKAFVGKSLTPEFAAKFIQGITSDAVKSTYADPYIDNFDDLTPSSSPSVDQTNASLEKIYGPLQESAIAETRRQFAPLRARAIEEEAASGRLLSGVSRAPTSAIGQIDANEGNALSQVIGSIAGQKASGALDLTKFGETVAASERRAKEAKSEFGQTLSYNQAKDQEEMDLNRKALRLSELIGRKQGQNQPGRGAAALSGGLSGAAAGGLAGGSWGALFGGLAGAGLGFASKDF